MNRNELEQLLEELENRKKYGGAVKRFFTTEEERDLYPHWMEFFQAGTNFKERMALCANQVGKTTAGLYEVTLHLTGLYPDWWEGHRFESGNDWWICGVSQNDIRDILQTRLLGKVGEFGSGFIPKDCLDFDTLKDAQKADVSVSTFNVKHVSGTMSSVTFKSYEQGREKFQGKPGISVLMDEEPPMDIYSEALMRTVAGNGRMILTFTPLKGVSDMVMGYLGDADIQSPSGPLNESRYLIRASWDDAPHLTEENKQALIRALPPYQRDARTRGIPTLGSGAIYPISEDKIFIEPFKIPDYWPRCFGMDVGWKCTAVVWGAIDPDTGVTYVYSEFTGMDQTPQQNALSILARGSWIPGAIDPASRGRGQDDGEALFDTYSELGLNISKADNAVETWLWNILSLMQNGQLKVFNTCTGFLKEFRMYRRDEKGRVVKKEDHIMDSFRYMISTGRDLATTNEPKKQYIPRPPRKWVG